MTGEGVEISNPLPPPEPEEGGHPLAHSESIFPIAPTYGKEGCNMERNKYKGRTLALFTSGGDAPGQYYARQLNCQSRLHRSDAIIKLLALIM
ncbi:unnamed protein product [Anisakis simplex]|uniref:Uncharacterized protein n=1 Tax=Anisakis simplex TaxID=6269 RepID=A0A0M3JQP5_ANISI|nr:unnamed protein product [Anisakis simplex]